MGEVDFSDRTVVQRWCAIKPNVREDLIPWTRSLLKRLLERSLDEELETYFRAARHQRSPERQDYRNRTYTRDLTTELGLLRALQVPRARTAGFQPQVFARYERRQPQVNRLLCAAFISGVSTRQVGPLTALLLEEAVSASTISRVTQALDAGVRRFQTRAVPDRYCYLLLDGIILKAKTPTGCRKRLVLCAYGLTPQGQRELLSFRQVPTESEATWTAFLTDLYQRELIGTALRLIVTDGQSGLFAALTLVYPFVRRQRCAGPTSSAMWRQPCPGGFARPVWRRRSTRSPASVPPAGSSVGVRTAGGRRRPVRWRVWNGTSRRCSPS